MDEALLVVADWLKNGFPTGTPRKTRPVAEIFTVEAVLSAVRTESFGREDAGRVLDALAKRGFIEEATLKGSPSSELALDFLRKAWTEDGPYVLERRAYGHSLTKRHIKESGKRIDRYFAAAFAGIRLCDLRRADIKASLVRLSEEGYSAATVNKAYATLSAPLGWAARNDIIAEDPSKGIPRFAAPSKKKGILDDEELSALFRHAWSHERARVAFMVAATTGARLGEVVALQARDIGEDRLYVRHSWNDVDRLKVPKNGEEREAALLPQVRRDILALLSENPHASGAETFVFYGAKPDRPIDFVAISKAFNGALASIGIDEKTRRERGISFHSLRHGYAKKMSDRLTTERAMKATGHLSKAMLDHYADHHNEEDLAAVGKAAEEAFGKVLEFSRAG
jgi:integrase